MARRVPGAFEPLQWITDVSVAAAVTCVGQSGAATSRRRCWPCVRGVGRSERGSAGLERSQQCAAARGAATAHAKCHMGQHGDSSRVRAALRRSQYHQPIMQAFVTTAAAPIAYHAPRDRSRLARPCCSTAAQASRCQQRSPPLDALAARQADGSLAAAAAGRRGGAG